MAEWFTGDPMQLAEVDDGSVIAWLMARPAWHADAACRGHGPARWFPKLGESVEPARAICAGCQVTEQCLTAALEQPPSFDDGIWAGTSAKTRRAMRRAITAA